MIPLRSLILSTTLTLTFAAHASALQVPFTGTLTLPGDITVLGSGVATVNQHPITQMTIPSGAFTTPVASGVVQVGGIRVGLFLHDLRNRPIILSGGGCTRDHPFVSCPGTRPLNGFGGIAGRLTAFFGEFNQPLSFVGSGSTVRELLILFPLAITATISGAGWTTGTVRAFNLNGVTIYSLMGTRNTGPGSTFATDTLSFVTPIMTSLDGTPVSPPGFARITIHLIPEPATLLLLSVGIVVLIAYGRRRTHSRSSASEGTR